MKSAADTLAAWRSSSFEWGSADCVMSVCSHIERSTGIDPGKHWRGTYSTESESRIIAEPYGGVLGIFSFMMEQAGFLKCDFTQSQEGDPVCIAVGQSQLIGIRTRAGIAFRVQRGCFEINIKKVEHAWII